MHHKDKETHHGHSVKRIRRSMGIKQESLAIETGMTQAMVSLYESKKVIDDKIIEKFAKALKVTPQLIKELDVDPVTIIIENNTFQEGSVGNISPYGENENFGNTYNPLEQIIELTKEVQVLYERMLELEREKNTLLEKMLKEKE